MVFVNANSVGGMKSELDLFSVKPIQDSIVSSYYAEFRPFSSGTEDIIEFVIPESPEYIDLTLSKLHLKVKIVDQDGKGVENKMNTDGTRNGLHAVPVNNFLDSLFNQVMVFLNHRCISPPTNNHYWKAYFENLLSYGGDAKNGHLSTSLYYEDSVDDFDNIDSPGFGNRTTARMLNGEIDLMGFLKTDLFKCGKLLLNNMHVRIKLYRNKPNFSLMTNDTPAAGKSFRIDIKDAVLMVRKVIVPEPLIRRNEALLTSHNAKYNINRVEVKTYTIPKNTIAHVIDNFFASQLPKRIFVAQIEEDREFNYRKNPYKFEHFNLSYAHLSGDSLTHLRPIRVNIERFQFMEAYSGFTDALNIYSANAGNAIAPFDYLKNTFILAWDISADMSSSANHISCPRTGVLRLELHYAKKLPSNIKLIIYAEFDSLLEITRNREAILDYSA